MNKDQNATETNAAPIVTQEGTVVVPTEIDYEAKYAQLEAEKAKFIEESANYKLAYLKESKKNKSPSLSEEEDDDTRMRRIANETLANSSLAGIAREQQEIINKALKENKELKKAQLNKAQGTPSAVGSHTEVRAVPDTLVSSEQIAAFKKRGWTDKDIEKYKQNLIKYR